MFKTLLFSTFLLFNVSGNVQKNNAVSYSTLNGSYCLRDNFDIDLVDDIELNTETFNIFDNSNFGWDYTPSIQKFNSTGNYYYIEWLETLNITYYKGDYGFGFALDIISESTKMSNNNNLITGTFDEGDLLFNNPTDFKYLIIWFPNPVTVSTISFKLFNSMFVSTGNDYCTYYNGYYAVISPNASTIIMFHGPIVVDNNLYNSFNYTNGNAYCDNAGYNGTQYVYIENGEIKGNNNILIGGTLINNTIMSRMSNIGVFSYVYEPVEYTFGDMIFSVIDAPVYMLSQLFGFELFGLQFYVAFMSIVTVVLICFVLKKII